MREGLIEIDGSRGEGGGQILRTSLALSMITGKPLAMRRVRAGRAKPGLRRQHLTCVLAAAELCNAEVEGAEVGSQTLAFRPGPLARGPVELAIDIGTAGSTSLVVQTILVPAIVAGHALRATIVGGTHNPMAPPFDFLDRVFLPILRQMGADVRIVLDRHGFATGAGAASGRRDFYDDETPHRGQLVLEVGPGSLRPIELVDTTPIASRHATSVIAKLPTHVADRELAVVQERLGWLAGECEVRNVRDGGPANLLMLEVQRAIGGELVSVFGEKGLPAEIVGDRACAEMQRYLDADVPVGDHLADQLLLPMAVAGGGRFRCAPLSLHATTNIDTIQQFLDVPITVEAEGPGVIVTVGSRS
ncbi:MAG TPA: RNA 3'-terminal phosphate cyclase [Kofleriaceae bacterium]|nr:RNA 3'-terminal phosphate cyclase [Kofleriaceae bacterium]